MSNIIALLKGLKMKKKKKIDQSDKNHLLSFFGLMYVSLHIHTDKQKNEIDCFVILDTFKIVPSLPGMI